MTQDSPQKKLSVGFVCLGNICRSPMAEAVFKHIVAQKGLSSRFSRIDSFGTAAYHVGETPDHRSTACCASHGVPVSHRAQKLTALEIREFDFLLVMDESNLRNVQNLAKVNGKESKMAQVKMFGEYRTDERYGKVVEDPYYGGSTGFERNFRQISHFTEVFLERELE